MSGDTSLPAKCRCYFVFIFIYIQLSIYAQPFASYLFPAVLFSLNVNIFSYQMNKKMQYETKLQINFSFSLSLSSPWIKLGPIELPIKNYQDKVNCYGKPIKMDTYPVSRKQRGTHQPVSGSRSAHPLFQLNLSIGHSILAYIKKLY